MQPFVIGIDIGTGSTKAVALNPGGQVLATAQRHYALQQTAPGLAEQSPWEVWEAFRQCLLDISTQLQQLPALVSLSSCMHSLIAVDEQGKPLTPLINWADARSGDVAERLRQSKNARALYEATGTPLHSMTPLTKIIWFRKTQPELFAAAARWISIKEFIWHRLFGLYEVDVSVAAATGMLDVRNLQWHGPALLLAGIREQQLSAVVPASFMRKGLVAESAEALGLDAAVSFCMGSSDGCMANIGSRVTAGQAGALTIGTSGAVRVTSAQPVSHYASMLFSYPLDAQTYVCGGAINNGGNVVHWLLRQLLQVSQHSEAHYRQLNELLQQVPPGSEGLLCLPHFIGERAPVWDEKSSGVFVGIRPQHGSAHFVRAALEGVCFALLDVLQHVEAGTGPVPRLHVSGGFIRSAPWVQMLADITGKELYILSGEDASATGAAIWGMKALGLIPHLNAVPLSLGQMVAPQAKHHQVYQKYFDLYKTIYPALKDTLHGLHYV